MRPCDAIAPVMSALLLACDAAPASDVPVDGLPVDGEETSFVSGKADGACVVPGSPAAQGILSLVNDDATSLAELDDPTSQGGVGLHRFAAEGLIDARPFDTLDEVDAVPYVGPVACRALARYACNEEQRCRQPVSVMTWNLRHFPLTDETEDAVVEILGDFAPDFVGIQEVQDPETLERIGERLGGYRVLQAEPGPYSGVAALVRESTLMLTNHDDLFEDDWFAFPRPMLEVEVDVGHSDGAAHLRLGVAHLKAMSDDYSKARRRAASQTLRGWFDDQGGENTLLLGDLNDEVTDAAWDNVFEPLLEDQADLAFLTEPLEAGGAATYIPWSRMLDHVVVTGGLEEAHVETEVLVLDADWTYEQHVSDHRPVLSRFEFPVSYDG